MPYTREAKEEEKQEYEMAKRNAQNREGRVGNNLIRKEKE